jgi:hypothetical protein
MASAEREPIRGSGGGAWNQGIYTVLGGQLPQLPYIPLFATEVQLYNTEKKKTNQLHQQSNV